MCITPDDDTDEFRLALIDTEYRFKTAGPTSALRVADAVRGCQYCELINWTPRDLCQWLHLSAVPEPTLERLTHHGIPGMQLAKLCARDDMVARLQEELEALTGLPDTAILDVLRPARSLQSENVRLWLEETNRREKGRRPEIDRAVRIWKQQVAIENAKLKHGGAHVPQHAPLLDDGGSDFSSEDELEEDGVLYVTVVKADKLPRLDLFGYDRVRSPSLYIQMILEDQHRHTPTADDTYEPRWNARFKLNVTSPESILLLDVYNSNMLQEDLHWATLKVPLLELAEGTTWNWYRLTDMTDESRSEARHNVLTEDQRQDQNECPKGCIQLKFQYAPPRLAVDRHQQRGARVTDRRPAITDIDRFIGAYAADNLDVEARITQGLLWSTRYVVLSSRYKGIPESEKFELLTYKDKRAWDNGAEALATLRLGESEITLDSRQESRGAGFSVTNRKGSAHFRAKTAEDAREWLTALRALQYAEMTQWNSAHVCRWLEAHNVEDGILHRVHESGVSGDFFARTVAANNYDMATTQLQEKAALSNTDATTIIGKLREAQLGSVQVVEWLDEANRDIHGKSTAIKQSSTLLKSLGVGKPAVVAAQAAQPATGRRPRRSSGDAELDARDAELTQRLDSLARFADRPSGTSGGGASKRFDPKKWQEEQSQRSAVREQNKLRREQEELQQHQAQTRGANLDARYPRGRDVYRGNGNNPDFSRVQSKYKKEAAQYRERVVERTVNESVAAAQLGRTVVPAPVPAKARRPAGAGAGGAAVPVAMRDPKRLEPKETGNGLATKLESLVAVHRVLQEHHPLIDVICESLREKDVKIHATKKERESRQRRELEHANARKKIRELEQQCDRHEKTVKAMQAANEGAMERYHKTREYMKQAEKKRTDLAAAEMEKQKELAIEKAKNRRLEDKLAAAQDLLKDRQMEYNRLKEERERETGGGGPDQAALKEELRILKEKLERVSRSEDCAKYEAKERGKVLVGAAEKLEKEQEKYRNMRAKLQAKAVQERNEGKREGEQEASRQLQELRQQVENATEMVFEISKTLGLQDGSRFKDSDEMNRHDMIKAVKDAVAKAGKHDQEKKAAQKEVRQLKKEVKELQQLLRQEQDNSYKMLEKAGGKGKGGGGAKAKSGGSGSDGLKQEVEKLKSLVAVHETQMEGERRNTAREKDRAMKLEQELRRYRHDLRAEKEHAEELSRHRVKLQRDQETEDRNAKAQLREHKQEQRLSKLQAGQWVQKYHEGGRSDRRWLSLSADNKMLSYGKSKAKSTKEIPIDDIRYIHFGYVSENMTTRHAEIMDCPEWMCFGIVLRTRTIDFSADTEEDAALWVIGLRTLLEQKRGDARGRAVGHFFWSRASMKTKALWEAAELEHPGRFKSHKDYLAKKLTDAARTWWDPGAPGPASAMSPSATLAQTTYRGGGASPYGGANYTLTSTPAVARRLSPGVSPRRMSPQRMSFESPGGGPGGGRYSPNRYSPARREPVSSGGFSPAALRNPTRSPSFDASQSRISPRAAPTTRLASPTRRSLSPVGRQRNYQGGN